MSENNHSQESGLWERILRSRVARGVFRVHVGFASARSWALDVRSPRATSIHLFDYLLYRRTDREEPFEEWLRNRKLLSP
jgi:hypothetical protein